MAFFRVLKKSTKSRARVGVIETAHGNIETPAFVPVATKGTLKAIPPRDFQEIGIQVAFVNTFHLTLHPGVEVIKKCGGIHEYANLNIPLMSDSAGFQVFSLGRPSASKEARGGLAGMHKKVAKTHKGDEILLQKIEEEGVRFRSPRDGREMLFTPEISIRNQEKIGADIMMAFDECIYYRATYEYAKEATERTHRWLLRCIKAKYRRNQFLYGIIQGGVFKDLRVESAKFVAQQDLDGVAIGGVSVGETKKELREQVRWVAPYLPDDKPIHLLGVGRIEDILDLVPYGIDTFDCVEPTRLARNGIVYQLAGTVPALLVARIDVQKTKYLKEQNPIQKTCACYTCQNFSLSYLHHLFKERELLGYYLATYHNLFFFEDFFRRIREEIGKGNCRR